MGDWYDRLYESRRMVYFSVALAVLIWVFVELNLWMDQRQRTEDARRAAWKATAGALTLYVDQGRGDDEGVCTQATPCRSVRRALELIPEPLNRQVRVSVAPPIFLGTWKGHLDLRGFDFGDGGRLEFAGAGGAWLDAGGWYPVPDLVDENIALEGNFAARPGCTWIVAQDGTDRNYTLACEVRDGGK